MMLQFYQWLTRQTPFLFEAVLCHRARSGKDDPARLDEKRGFATKKRPKGKLLWIHAASVGESQSALILIHRLLETLPSLNILVTTGTKTSAAMMAKNLPKRAFHQFAPLDHPPWVEAFLDHWQPDTALWMESELWPNMLSALKQRDIPAALINARLSSQSLSRWALFRQSVQKMLSAFDMILTQTGKDAAGFQKLGANNVITTGNLKYSAAPLPFDKADLNALQSTVGNRPLWVYASTHKGEEELAARVHHILKSHIPDILSIIVPRHPERRDEIEQSLEHVKFTLRGTDKKLPRSDDDLYIADTLGEMGLFYRLAPIAVIGRSFSDDGGGGHNPIESAQLHCAVLSGPHVQYQQQLFDDMISANAAQIMHNEQDLVDHIRDLLDNPAQLQKAQETAHDFVTQRADMVDDVMKHLAPLRDQLQSKKGRAA